MSEILRPEFPNPPPDRHASEGGASPGAPLAMPPGEATIAASVLDCSRSQSSRVVSREAARGYELDTPQAAGTGCNPIHLLCKTLERAALTKEQRFRRWLVDNPIMERNPYARQWFENAEAYRLWDRSGLFDKDYHEEREGDFYR